MVISALRYEGNRGDSDRDETGIRRPGAHVVGTVCSDLQVTRRGEAYELGFTRAEGYATARRAARQGHVPCAERRRQGERDAVVAGPRGPGLDEHDRGGPAVRADSDRER